MEFSQVSLPVLKQIYDVYSFNVIPKIGGLVANDEASYQYLVESIRQFPDQVRVQSSLSLRQEPRDHVLQYIPLSHLLEAHALIHFARYLPVC